MEGWICPRCGTVHGPFVQQCHCSPPTMTVASAEFIQDACSPLKQENTESKMIRIELKFNDPEHDHCEGFIVFVHPNGSQKILSFEAREGHGDIGSLRIDVPNPREASARYDIGHGQWMRFNYSMEAPDD